MLAKDIMTTHVITVAPSMSLKEVAALFLEHNISGAPVVNEHNVLEGIITEGDLVRQQQPIEKPLYLFLLDSSFPLNYKKMNEELEALTATSAEQLMTREVISLPEYAEVSEVADLMLRKHINRIPVINEDEQLLGIITRQDVIRATYLQDNE